MIGANLIPLREVYQLRADVTDDGLRDALVKAWFTLRLFAKIETQSGHRASARAAADTARNLIERFGERIGGAQ